MLKIIISGNIGADAVIRDGGNGKSAIGFSVGTSKKIKGENVTTWVKCTKWINEVGSTAIADYLKKGVKVLVVGEANSEVYQDKKTEKYKSNITCNVMEIELIGSKSEDSNTQNESTPVAQSTPVDALPF